MKPKLHIFLLIFIGLTPVLEAQVLLDSLMSKKETISSDTLVLPDSLQIQRDIIMREDSLFNDGAVDSGRVIRKTYKLSKDSLDAEVDYGALDSMRYDIKNKRIHLYGDAQVNYTTIKLKADYIILDWETNTVTALEGKDSLGLPKGIPEFADGDETFKSKKLRYNFKSRKGIVYDARSTHDDVHILSKRAKFFAKNPADSINRSEDVIYSRHAIFTSCDADVPHYGIRSNKQKIITNKTVVVGPSRIEIGNVPTPIWLPFGFFPVTAQATAGLIFPQNYGYDNNIKSFGLDGIGYFTPLGEHFDLQLTADLYWRNRWGVHATSRYKKRYGYNGGINLSYSTLGTENSEGKIDYTDSYIFRWSHNQDRSAHPNLTFGGSVDIQTQDYRRTFETSYNEVTKNILTSNLSLAYVPTAKPWNLSASMSHSQNTQTKKVTITLPDINFQTQNIYPFKNKKNPKNAWYEKVQFKYSAKARNRLEATDSTLFNTNIADKLQYGVQQTANTSVTFNVLKYFRLSPNASFTENWYFKEQRKTFDPTTIVLRDSVTLEDGSVDYTTDTIYGQLTTDTLSGFKPFHQFRAGVSLNTDVFGTLLFKKGFLRGLRHHATPSISFNYSPDYQNPNLGYGDYVDTDNRDDYNEEIYYNKFLSGVFSRPSLSGKQANISYGIRNVFEAKYFSRKDSSSRKIKLFDNINIGGSYNAAADSLQWSPVSISGRSSLLKNFLDIKFTATFDPYVKNSENKSVLALNEKGRLLEFRNFAFPITNNITFKKLRLWVIGDDSDEEEEELDEEELFNKGDQELEREALNTAVEASDFFELFDNFRISHNMNLNITRIDDRDTFIISRNSLRLSGSVQISQNWNISLDNFSYDFKAKQFVYPSFSFSRNLHCWEMGAGWQPSRGTYSFFLRVKPGTLGFIEVPYRVRNYNF